MQGTRDFSAFLCVSSALTFLKANHWDKVAKDCRNVAHVNYARFCSLLGTKPLAPVHDLFLGQMCSIPVKTDHGERLQKVLFEEYQIEIPVMKQNEAVYIRYSIQAFNNQSDLDCLYHALSEIRNKTDLIDR